MKKLIILVTILCTGCGASKHNSFVNSSSKVISNQETNTIASVSHKALKSQRNQLLDGAKKIKTGALAELTRAENCVKMMSMKLTARSSYEEALIETKNRAYRSGANAIAIVEWKELPNSMILTSHIFSCAT